MFETPPNRFVDSMRLCSFPALYPGRASQPAVAAVAEGFVFGMFAGAPRHRFFGVDLRLDGGEFGAFVRAVAKRLGGGAPASAPPICSRLGGLNNRAFLEYDWFAHNFIFCYGLARPLLTSGRSIG